MNVQWQSLLTCPRCGFQEQQTMPADGCVVAWKCPQCQALVKPKPGDWCVFCSYGSVPCPAVQMNAPGNCCGDL